MSSFVTPLRLEFIGEIKGRPWFRVLEEFVYEIGGKGSGYYIRVRVGFKTDFASIPRIFWFFLSPFGRYGKAAVVHDWLYNRRGGKGFTKIVADAIFYEAMVLLKVPWYQREIIYYAVRLFGKPFYKRGKRNVKKRRTPSVLSRHHVVRNVPRTAYGKQNYQSYPRKGDEGTSRQGATAPDS